ncbi:hypothetical protein NC651_031513 [Populus alba x Populus x berolinensis]|nr:hypothetical protein NC651_031513 [Populus alba x Populus x berolinensis]
MLSLLSSITHPFRTLMESLKKNTRRGRETVEKLDQRGLGSRVISLSLSLSLSLVNSNYKSDCDMVQRAKLRSLKPSTNQNLEK